MRSRRGTENGSRSGSGVVNLMKDSGSQSRTENGSRSRSGSRIRVEIVEGSKIGVWSGIGWSNGSSWRTMIGWMIDVIGLGNVCCCRCSWWMRWVCRALLQLALPYMALATISCCACVAAWDVGIRAREEAALRGGVDATSRARCWDSSAVHYIWLGIGEHCPQCCVPPVSWHPPPPNEPPHMLAGMLTPPRFPTRVLPPR